MNYIVLYSDDYDYDVWREYCDICNVPHDVTWIRIEFNLNNVEAE